jgi:hypothetical protein
LSGDEFERNEAREKKKGREFELSAFVVQE